MMKNNLPIALTFVVVGGLIGFLSSSLIRQKEVSLISEINDKYDKILILGVILCLSCIVLGVLVYAYQ